MVGSTGSARLVGQDRLLVVASPLGVERVPHRDRHAEVALPADAPVLVQVARPVLVAVLHVARVPRDARALREQRLLVRQQAHEPLARRHQLERAIALLVVLDHVLDRARLAVQRRAAAPSRCRPARAAARRCAVRACLSFLPGELGVGAVGGVGVAALPALAAELDRREPPVALHDLAQRQPLLAPPLDVGGVAEGADHQDAGALLGVDLLGREDRHRHAEERRQRALAEERVVARVVRVRGDADAGRQQLGARGRDREARRRPRRRTRGRGRRPATLRSSSSACAIAHWKSTSQSVGA